MRAFRFRLQTLQRLREQHRDEAQQKLAAAQQRTREMETHRLNTREEINELESHLRISVQKKKLDVDRAMDGHRHKLSLQARLNQLDEAILAANQEVRKCRLKLVEADREVKVLEKLHERQLAEHGKQLAAHEAKQLDEAAAIRASRQTKTA